MFLRDITFKTKTKKQEVESIVKDALLDLSIERNEAFKNAVRNRKTNIRVSKKETTTNNIWDSDDKITNKIIIPEIIVDDIEDYEDKVKYIKNMLKPMLCEDTDGDEDYFSKSRQEPKQYEANYGIDSELKEFIDDESGQYKFSINARYKTKEDKEKEDNEQQEEDDCDIQEMMSGNQEEDNLIYEFQDNESDDENKKEQEEQRVLNTWIRRDNRSISESRIKESKALANKLIQSFKGRNGKSATVVPNKKINSRLISDDFADKIYISEQIGTGKYLGKVNLIIDTSGSMDGTPIYNAIQICLVFNEIDKQGYCYGNIIFSQSRKRHCIAMPLEDKVLSKCIDANDAEGLKQSIEAYKEELKNANNICITDGDICDGSIDLSKYKGIKIIGVYVNNTPEPETFNGSLNRWFNQSLVRPDVSSLIQKLIHLKLRSK